MVPVGPGSTHPTKKETTSTGGTLRLGKRGNLFPCPRINRRLLRRTFNIRPRTPPGKTQKARFQRSAHKTLSHRFYYYQARAPSSCYSYHRQRLTLAISILSLLSTIVLFFITCCAEWKPIYFFLSCVRWFRHSWEQEQYLDHIAAAAERENNVGSKATTRQTSKLITYL